MMRSMTGGAFWLDTRKSVGRVPWRMVYFLRNNPITLSTWILTFAIPLVFSTSTGSNWLFPLVNAGITSSACLMPTLSATAKPLSAKTTSPGTSLSKNPQFSVKNLSEVRPPHDLETKEMEPCGVIPIKILIVVMMLAVGKCLSSSQKSRGFFNKYFETVNNYCYFLAKWILKASRHSLPELISFWPEN